MSKNASKNRAAEASAPASTGSTGSTGIDTAAFGSQAESELSSINTMLAEIDKEQASALAGFDQRRNALVGKANELRQGIAALAAKFGVSVPSVQNAAQTVERNGLTFRTIGNDEKRTGKGRRSASVEVVKLANPPAKPTGEGKNPRGALVPAILLALLGSSKGNRRTVAQIARAIVNLGPFSFVKDGQPVVAFYGDSQPITLSSALGNANGVETFNEMSADGLVSWEDDKDSHVWLTAKGEKAAMEIVALNS